MVTPALVGLCLLWGADPDIDTIRAALRLRQQSIRSLDVTYTLVRSPDAAASAVPQRFRWLQQGTQKLLSSDTWIDPTSKLHDRCWYSFDGRHAYSVFFAPQATEHTMQINKTHVIDRSYTVNATLAKALGYAIHYCPNSLVELLTQQNAVFHGTEEDGGSPLCHVSVPRFAVWDGMASRLEVWLDPNRDYWPRKLVIEWLGTEANPQPTGMQWVYTLDDFQKHSDSDDSSITYWFPMSVTEGRSYKVNVQNVVINKVHPAEAFRPVLNVGVRVVDETELRNLEVSPVQYLMVPLVQFVGGSKGEEEYQRVANLSRKAVGLEKPTSPLGKASDASASRRFPFGMTFLSVAMITGAIAIWFSFRR